MKRIASIALALLVVAACDAPPTAPSSAGRPSLAAGGSSGPSAGGAGHFDINGSLRTFSFTAVTHKDGTVKGQAQLYNRDQDIRDHIEIDCLEVVGNIAIVSGTIKSSSAPEQVGLGVLFSVQDNGEGGKAPADMMSLAYLFTVDPLTTCHNSFVPPDHEIAGNVQVKP